MIRWLNKISTLNSPEASATSLNASSPNKWNSAYASDPSEWERIFDAKWAVAEKVLEKKLTDVEHDVNYEEMTSLLESASHMCNLLMLEVNSQPEPAIGPILDRYFTQQIFERILDWAIQLPEFLKPTCQLALIRMYEGIVGGSHTQNHCLLVHKPILNPLLRLCEWCKRADGMWYREPKRGDPSTTEKHFVLLLNQICTKLAEDRTLLHFFFYRANGFEQFTVFTLLIPFLYEQNDVGQLSRDALLLILSVSAHHSSIAEFVASKTDFCPVVATGLSGCFSQLDRVLLGDGGERSLDEQKADALLDFHSSLLFCNAVVQAGHVRVVEQICDFFYSGFLISVVKPVLLQDDREWIAACLSYLQMCVEVITESALLFTIFRLLLTERDDGGSILYERIILFTTVRDKAAVVSLSLLESLSQLCCEDFMLATIFHPLLSTKVANRRNISKTVQDRNRCVSLSEKILEAVPSCILPFREVCSQHTLATYLTESRIRMEARCEQCAEWKWRYDGSRPKSYLANDSDDEPSSQINLSVRSSSRSSTSLGLHGVNRYFHSSHTSSDYVNGDVGALGLPTRNDSLDSNETEFEEDANFVLPPLNDSRLMTSSMVDYFQIASLDDLSESDDQMTNTQMTVVEPETDGEMMNSFILSGWQDVEDKETLLSLLGKRAPTTTSLTTDQLVDFVEQKLNSMQRDPAENTIDQPRRDSFSTEKPTTTGFSVSSCSENPLLLTSLLQALDSLCDNSLPFNIELCNLLATLLSFPQPILSFYLFDSKNDNSKNSIISTLNNLKTRIDCMAEGVEGFEVWVGRALRTLEMRSVRIRRQHHYNAKAENNTDDSISTLFWGRSFGGSRRLATYRLHSHKWMESLDSQRDDTTAKQTAHAAILLANLCQMLAAIVIQQSVSTYFVFSNSPSSAQQARVFYLFPRLTRSNSI
ncbi:unnamed protein product [Caenorhabditis auriculariae]|uniref:FHF complex subunit HOOK-interacting protein C-terminal domain-containing protein n=1 Tax=Caenorhabditis auriculariae TaxID=2777116 RepID=A0A8S1GY83_9PELO|nr:unnamed protein product [Caenorhabditis auriculariae]